jgi:hypothetical protein
VHNQGEAGGPRGLVGGFDDELLGGGVEVALAKGGGVDVVEELAELGDVDLDDGAGGVDGVAG